MCCAFVLPRLKAKLGANGLVTVGEVGTAIALLLFGLAREPIMAVSASLIAGTSWIGVLANLNVSAQVALPEWVRGRGLAMYVMVFFGTMTVAELDRQTIPLPTTREIFHHRLDDYARELETREGAFDDPLMVDAMIEAAGFTVARRDQLDMPLALPFQNFVTKLTKRRFLTIAQSHQNPCNDGISCSLWRPQSLDFAKFPVKFPVSRENGQSRAPSALLRQPRSTVSTISECVARIKAAVRGLLALAQVSSVPESNSELPNQRKVSMQKLKNSRFVEIPSRDSTTNTGSPGWQSRPLSILLNCMVGNSPKSLLQVVSLECADLFSE